MFHDAGLGDSLGRISIKPEKLPSGILTWFSCDQQFTLDAAERQMGRFAAEVYRIHAHDREGTRFSFVYKRLLPERNAEVSLYRGPLQQLSAFAPRCYAIMDSAQEQGVLLDDAGTPLKELLLTCDDAPTLLIDAVKWLAHLHLSSEEQTREWLNDRLIAPYPIQSSIEWSTAAIESLQWFVQQVARTSDAPNSPAQITKMQIDQLSAMAARFYKDYPHWLDGRLTLTHGDPHLNNLLYCNGRWRLIDWEYMCAAVPQRDIAILLQEVMDPGLQADMKSAYMDELRQANWPVDTLQWHRTLHACSFDNTLMMLGWEVGQFRIGRLSRLELEGILTRKLGWIVEAYQRIYD